LVRGGTSKGVYVCRDELSKGAPDESILALFGSPDSRQIDGLGGGTSTTSKLMIVGESEQEDVDAEFTFAQVATDKSVVDYGGTCGNLTFGIGPFAIYEDIVEVDDVKNEVKLRLYNTNTDSHVEQVVPVQDGYPKAEGDFKVYGVPQTYARIDSTFLDPSGAETDRLFPLGESVTELDTPDRTYEVSVVDVVNPVVFAHAEDLGLTGTELPEDIDGDSTLLNRIENVRGAACEALGYIDDVADSDTVSPGVPKLAFVSGPQSYTTSNGSTVDADSLNLTARIMSMQKLHPIYAVSGACCTAVAALLPETIPNQVADITGNNITLGHPKGVMSAEVNVEPEANAVHSVTVPRTSRRLIEGTAYYQPDA
jgi:2-methylaconitate cis-trans-isomerase PrpF